jgi:hypothetical protein
MSRRCIGTIAYPCMSPMAWDDFGFSFAQLVQKTQEYVCKAGEFVAVDRAPGISDAAVARNMIAARMRGEWLFTTDCDHKFEPDLVLRLLHRLKALGADVMTGLYFDRKPPCPPQLFNQPSPGIFERVGVFPMDGPFQVPGAGAGCLLIKREVFERIGHELKEEPFAKRQDLGEDLSFFWRCAELKLRVVCDPRIQHPHLGVRTYDDKDFERGAFIVKKEGAA